MSSPIVAGLTTLPALEASQVMSAHPELADADALAPLVLAVTARDAKEAAVLTDLLAVMRDHLRDASSIRNAVMQALLPTDRDFPVPPALLDQVNRNAKARGDLAREFGLLSSADVAALAESASTNASAMASRWKAEGKVFTTGPAGGQRFPGFQFGQDGRPLPVIAQVLVVLGERLSGWELALWFTGSNGWLGGVRPVDVLDSDAELVVEAAGHLAAELLG
ncbi:hypothetical protein SAMN05661080_04804 [Modestobacter sp. DSM 44400]|uniref:hypothetical protein n=1 Tax=Modestobacter sp. DSM 44400 TaxID=1550230 RepID=UPI0008949469|nr:hypothetical protein [Modestobacter sp. DSM 44400]SDY85088.1 hypothetical protein SAMN05661080_04804 [Modestobacter sp. DSM 44400]